MANGYDGVVFLVGYDSALTGITTDNRAVYEYWKMVELLMERDGMSEDDAVDYLENNVIGALPCICEGSPVIVMPLAD